MNAPAPATGTAARLQHLADSLMAGCLAVMAVAVFINVVLRYGFGNGIAASEEVSAGRPIAEWVQWRDDHLVEVVKLQQAGHLTEEIDEPDLSDPRRLSFAVPAIEGFTHAERQRFLEMTSSAERLQKGVEVLTRIVERVQVTQQIQKIIGGNGHPPKDALQKLSAGNEPEKS